MTSLSEQRSTAAWAASERSGEATHAGSAVAAPHSATPPEPEVTARPTRRRYSAEYKKKILDQVDAAPDAKAVGAILRREGLYSSNIATWARQRQQGGLDALAPQKRGPKVTVSPLVIENRRLQAANARLQKQLKNAQLIIEVQKKVAAMLGNPIPNVRIDEEN